MNIGGISENGVIKMDFFAGIYDWVLRDTYISWGMFINNLLDNEIILYISVIGILLIAFLYF